eukprot:6458035-Amphidinium_carterae.2
MCFKKCVDYRNKISRRSLGRFCVVAEVKWYKEMTSSKMTRCTNRTLLNFLPKTRLATNMRRNLQVPWIDAAIRARTLASTPARSLLSAAHHCIAANTGIAINQHFTPSDTTRAWGPAHQRPPNTPRGADDGQRKVIKPQALDKVSAAIQCRKRSRDRITGWEASRNQSLCGDVFMLTERK